MAIWKRIKKYDKDVREDEDFAMEAESKIKETEKGDFFAMMVSAFLVIWVPCLIILILLCGLAYLFLGLPFAG